MTNHPETFDDEIEIIDYLRVIWKWKYLILIGTVLCIFVVIGISIYMPKVYSVKMTIELGVLGLNDSGQEFYVDSSAAIKKLIERGTFDNELILQPQKASTINPSKRSKFKVNILADTALLEIFYETGRVDRGISTLKQLVKSVSKKYEDKVNIFRNKYENDIRQKKRKISFLRKEASLAENRINNLIKRLAELEKEIQSIDRDAIMLDKHKDALVNSDNESGPLAEFLCDDAIRQNSNLRNRINDQIFHYRSDMERAKTEQKNAEIRIDDLLENIDNLEKEKNSIVTIRVLQPPTSSSHPIKPKVKRNTILAGTGGIFLMIILAFFIEYINLHRKKERL
jgi:uncharacterized protein involved in exopolysaccharide biosynthesis